MNDLKPCPFCGVKLVPMPTYIKPDPWRFLHEERDCILSGMVVTPEQWNTRAIESELLEALKQAVEVIRMWWSGDGGVSDKGWKIYCEHSPKMRIIMAAIAKAEEKA